MTRESELAPGWHTALLVTLIVLVAVVGTVLRMHGAGGVAAPVALTTGAKIAGVYGPMLFVQVAMVVYVSRVGRPRSALGALLGRRWDTPRRALGDIALGLAGWVLLLASEAAWARVAGVRGGGAVVTMLPHTTLERLAWVVLASAVGVSEEVVYRGYLQQQLGAFARRPAVGVVGQAVLFGLAHAEQGAATMGRFAGYGLAFGLLARWRRSLVPGIVGHAWTDIVSGLVRR